MKTRPENTLKKRIGPGFWIDENDHLHVSAVEMCNAVGLPNTPENRELAIQAAAEVLKKLRPDAKQIFRDHPYEISEDGKSIRCFYCEMTSYNDNDVKHRYCGNCHRFLDDPPCG